MLREITPSRLHGNMRTVRLRAMVLAVTALALAACTGPPTVSPTTTAVPNKPLPAVDLSAIPRGWVPVAYGDTQMSVPPTFPVGYDGQYECEGTIVRPGLVSVGPALNAECPGPPTWGPDTTNVDLRPAQLAHKSYTKSNSVVINGVRLFRVTPNPKKGDLYYYVPSLGVVVFASGPMARSIVDTLTRSPRTVVLAPGPEQVVPSGWRVFSYEKLAFAAPRSWPVIRTALNFGVGHCSNSGAIFFGPNVILSTDHQIAEFRCLAPEPVPQFPQEGVQVDAGTQTLSQLAQQGLRLSFSKHCLTLNGLTACPATSPAYSILVLEVTAPGRSKPLYVSIGLAGNGMVARTILYSLRAV